MPEEQAPDPIPIADDLCEILSRDGYARRATELIALLGSAGSAIDGVIEEVGRRELLVRLLPTGPSPESARIIDLLVDGAIGDRALVALAFALIARGGEYDRVGLSRVILRADDQDVLAALFEEVIQEGKYDALMALLHGDGMGDSPALRALAAARPTYDKERLNAGTCAAIRKGGHSGSAPYDVLIIPGFTPLDAHEPTPIAKLPAAQRRLDAAIEDLRAGLAPLVLVSGGSVHPPGTPLNEALMMRDYLIEREVSPDRILVDPHARHSTTNLRNAGRMMRELGLARGLIVTGYESPVFSQAFYFAHPTLSTFDRRSVAELGYTVGELEAVDERHIAFRPSPDVDALNYRDPLDA